MIVVTGHLGAEGSYIYHVTGHGIPTCFSSYTTWLGIGFAPLHVGAFDVSHDQDTIIANTAHPIDQSSWLTHWQGSNSVGLSRYNPISFLHQLRSPHFSRILPRGNRRDIQTMHQDLSLIFPVSKAYTEVILHHRNGLSCRIWTPHN